jgi:4-amino-4-deoxy-L-arabinose transferase-like glycosyltransferase
MRSLTVALIVVLLARLVTLGMPDLVDTTEGRYATVAKLMLERDDWVTPWLIYKGHAEPYLGKPPLHFWLVQTSYLVFGLGNASARLPGVVSGAATCLLVGILGRAILGGQAGLIAALVLACSTLFFFLSGSVVLDVTLTFGITLALVSFALADRSKLWGYLLFVGLALGVLVKGPLAVILAALTIIPWSLLRRYMTGAWPTQIYSIPWISGASIMIALVIPWYLWAEVRNPGFLEYFLITENYERFTNPAYGDKYGTGHVQPPGVAWIMMIPALFPWIFIVLAMSAHFFKKAASPAELKRWLNDPWLTYFSLWTLGTPALLTFATQYTSTYLVPVLPGFAALAAMVCHRWDSQSDDAKRRGKLLLFGITVFLSVVVTVGSITSLWFEGEKTNAAIGFVLGTVMLTFTFRQRFYQHNSYRLISQVGIYTALAYGLSSLCFDNHISNSRSTNRILTLAASHSQGEGALTVGFRGSLPFSASFYRDLLQHSPITVIGVSPENLSSTRVDFIAVKKRDVTESEQLLNGASLVGNRGKWYLYDLRSRPVGATSSPQ